ncbi:MAG: hypothetical protein ACR2RV_10930 [Verrucomicrobiales bacterium]
MIRSRSTTLLSACFLMFLGACSSSLQPKHQWTASMRSAPLRDVQVESEGGRYRGRGSGVILHSSKEHGTFILTCGHVASLSEEIRQKASLGDFAADVGKVTECSGATVGVRVHESSADGRADWREWSGFQGDVLFSKHVIQEWPFPKDHQGFSFKTGSLPEISIVDLAVIHLRTGAEPLDDVSTASSEAPFENGWSTIRGVSYFENRPYQEEIVLFNDHLFGIDGEYCSGSGVYNADDELIGIYSFRSGLSTGELTIDDREFDISAFYYYVPLRVIREELEARGLAFLIE